MKTLNEYLNKTKRIDDIVDKSINSYLDRVSPRQRHTEWISDAEEILNKALDILDDFISEFKLNQEKNPYLKITELAPALYGKIIGKSITTIIYNNGQGNNIEYEADNEPIKDPSINFVMGCLMDLMCNYIS